MSERKHPPTHRALEAARRHADLPRALLPKVVLALLALAFTLPAALAVVARYMAFALGHAVAQASARAATPSPYAHVELLAPLLQSLPIPLLALCVAAVVGTFAGGGFARPPGALRCRGPASPWQLWQQMPAAAFDLVRSVLVFVPGLLLVPVLARSVLRSAAVRSPAELGPRLVEAVRTPLLFVAAIALAVAVLEVLVARRRWLARHRQTDAEFRQQQRQDAPAPQLRRHVARTNRQ